MLVNLVNIVCRDCENIYVNLTKFDYQYITDKYISKLQNLTKLKCNFCHNITSLLIYAKYNFI